MKFYSIFLSSVVVIYSLMQICEVHGRSRNLRQLDPASLNEQTVALVLKANGKKYYVSSELCPGGVFLTRSVNENCICYNGVFQLVRQCCDPVSTSIYSDNLEFGMNFKCGPISHVRNNKTMNHPIRAILPLTKPYNRFGSMIVSRFLLGNNTKKWRKFDTKDIIKENDAQVDMDGKTKFEIINIKPLEKEIKIRFGKFSDMTVCYGGWKTEVGFQNLRVRILRPGATKDDCCFNVTQNNTPGKIGTTCSRGVILVEIINLQSADIGNSQCDQNTSDDAPYTINNRKSTFDYKIHKSKNDFAFDFVESNDILGERRSILFKRQVSRETTSLSPLDGSNEIQTTEQVISPRKRGLSRASLQEQAQAINEFIAILRNDMSVQIREPQTDRFRMLRKSFEIFLTVIPNEVVPNMLMTTAFDVFFFLYEELEPIVYAPSDLFEKTMRDLDQCLDKESMFNFTSTGCPQQIDELIIDKSIQGRLDTYYKGQPEELKQVLKALKHVEIRKDKRFIAESHDVYVELNWKVFDFVHSLCFDYFGKEFNAHTYYETELEALFAHKDVQRRWHTERANLAYVRGIFPVADLKMSMKQLDKVVAIAHHISRYNGSYWLERPQPQKKYSPNLRNESEFASRTVPPWIEVTTKGMNKEKQFEKRSAMMDSTVTTYPFQYALPPGEVIWDGMAVCLHADYSDSKGYFVDSDMWGVAPSLFELGQLYT